MHQRLRIQHRSRLLCRPGPDDTKHKRVVYLVDPSEPEDPLSAEIAKAFLQCQDEPGGVEAERLRYLRDTQADLQTPNPQDDGASPPLQPMRH